MIAMTPEQRLDQLERLMATAARNINANTEAIAQLRASQQQTDDHMRRLSDIFVDTIRVIGIMQNQFTEMQAEIREIRTDIRGLQRENQRTLDYLFGERGDNPPDTN